MKRLFPRTLGKTAAVGLTLAAALLTPAAHAVLIPSDLTVTGSVSFDLPFASPGLPGASPYAVTGNGAESGTMSVIAGGVNGATASH